MATVTEYPLASSYRAAARLNLQHYLWKQSLGYLLHPNIPAAAHGQDFRVADIGTGTGIWLLDLCASLPSSVQLHGFDVDLTQCPPKEWLPANVLMRHLNIHDDVPEELFGQYDIIHIRFFLVVVKDNDPTSVLCNVMKMLKPGGWIQWTEQDLSTSRVVTAHPKLSTGHTEALRQFAIAPTPTWPLNHGSWVANLAHTFETAGLQDVKEDRRDEFSWHLSHFQDVTLLAMEEISLKLPDGPDVRRMIQRAAMENEDGCTGVAIATDRVTFVGRKV